MKFGLSNGFKRREILQEAELAGFDYIELPVKVIAAYTEEEYQDVLDFSKTLRIPLTNANQLFPGDIALVGPNRDLSKIKEYLELALGRMQKFGVNVVVLGSGDSRRIPEGYTKEQTLKELAEVCETCIAPAAEKFGLEVVIEPLNKNETDIMNTVSESVSFFEATRIPRFRLLCDGYHMSMNGEDYSEIEKTGKNLRLMHIANPNGRTIPAPSDGDIYEGYFKALRNIGYDGQVTCEGVIPKDDENGTRLEKLQKCVSYLRTL